jgi:hypothetical protein
MYINNYDEEQELRFVNMKLATDLHDQVMIFFFPPKSFILLYVSGFFIKLCWITLNK